MDEVFGDDNFVAQIVVQKTGWPEREHLSQQSQTTALVCEGHRAAQISAALSVEEGSTATAESLRLARVADGSCRVDDAEPSDVQLGRLPADNLTSQRSCRPDDRFARSSVQGTDVSTQAAGYWKTDDRLGLDRLIKLAGSDRRRTDTLRYKRFLDDFPAYEISNIWTRRRRQLRSKIYVVQTATAVVERCLLMATDPGDSCSTDVRFWHHRVRRRAMGPPLDHDRHVARGAGAGPRADHGRAISVLHCSPIPPRACARRPRSADGVRDRQADARQRPPRLRLRARAAHHAEVDRQQRRDRRHLRRAPAEGPGRARRLNAALRGHKTPFRVTTGGREGKDVRFDAPADATFTMPSGEVVSASALVEWEVPREAPADWPDAAQQAARRLLGGAHRPAEGDRRVDRGQGGVRVPLRPAVLGSQDRPRRRAVHRREPQPAPHARRGRERRADRSAAGQGERPPYADVRADDPREPARGRRPAGAQGGRITFTSLTPWPGEMVCAEGRYPRGRRREAGRHLHRPGVRHRVSGQISSRPRARPATPASTSSSPAPSTTRRTPASSASSDASRCSRRA